MSADQNQQEDQNYVASERQRRAAVRRVASSAIDAQDCAELLAALGLDARDGIGRSATAGAA